MSLQNDKIREKADHVLDILLEAGRWGLAIAFIAGALILIARAFSSGP